MASFDELAMEYGSGFISYDQGNYLGGNSLTNPYLRMNVANRGGVCLGLAMGFLLYSRRFWNVHPLIWVNRFMTDSYMGWEQGGNLHNVSNLQTFIGTAMQEQRVRGLLQGRTGLLQDGMWGVSLKFMQSNIFDWGGDDLMELVKPHVRLGIDDAYWLIAAHSATGGHAMALRSMVHPNTGYRLLVFFEPNYGVVEFQGITCIAKLTSFLQGFALDEGATYMRNAELYRFA